MKNEGQSIAFKENRNNWFNPPFSRYTIVNIGKIIFMILKDFPRSYELKR